MIAPPRGLRFSQSIMVWQPKIGPHRLMPSIHCQSSRLNWPTSPAPLTPALFTSRSIAGQAASSRERRRSPRVAAAKHRGARLVRRRRPRRTSSSVSWAPVKLTSAMAICQPSRARRKAMARPRPLAAPVINGVFDQLTFSPHEDQKLLRCGLKMHMPTTSVAAMARQETVWTSQRWPTLLSTSC